MTKPLGVVLAGGLSRRMEGTEKSLLVLGGTEIITRVADRLGRQVRSLIINANGDPARFEFLSYPVASDTIEGFAGPLAGVLAGMRWAAKNSESSHIITAASDTPFFPADYVDKMLTETERTGSRIALATSNGRRHPVFGLWPVSLADELEHFLAVENNRKVMLFVDRYPNCLVDFDGQDPDPFFNINTPDDMEAAERSIAEQLLP